MRSERIEEIGSGVGGHPVEPVSQRVGKAFFDAARERELDDRIGDLAEALATASVDQPDRVLLRVAEVLGRGLGADRVSCYVPLEGALLESATDRLARRAEWSRRGAGDPTIAPADPSRHPDALSLAALPGGLASLRAGQVERLAGVRPISVRTSGGATRPGDVEAAARGVDGRWTPLRPTRVVPCMGAAGLLGLLCIEGGAAARIDLPAVLGRVERVARLAAGFLDRLRLSRALAATRTRHERDERLSTLGRVASSVAHDFNNVLTAILGYADLLELDLPARSPGHTELHEIREAASRGAELVEQVLGFGRTRTQGGEPVDVDALLARLQSMLARVAGRDVVVEIVPPEAGRPDARVEVDPGRLEHVLLNLASNARDAIAERGEGRGRFSLATRVVEVDATGRESGAKRGDGPTSASLAAGRYLRITASDDGCGLPERHARRVFEPFFTTKAPGAGTGLGLATTAELMRDAHGAIRVESAPGEGSAFHLYFPLVETCVRVSSPDAVCRPPSTPPPA